MTSSPLRAGVSLEEELDYYKKQYEQLETDLADFQASSKELEEQLERDIENAEKSERKLKEQVEKLRFEVEEWKTKHKQAKTEANGAQNTLQKEITTMRETSRSLQLRLRDIEVVNDDYERQARNTESSLEDMESKYNVAIERGVLLDEEVKGGEQEREALRIETQRLKDELGDLKVESDITLEKLRLADNTIERLRSRKPSPLAVESLRTGSQGSEASGLTPPSPTASTPPPKSDSASEVATPPSPPLSDAPANGKLEPRTPMPGKRKSLIPDSTTTPRPVLHGPRTAPKHSRGPSAVSSSGTSTSDARAMKPPVTKPRQVSRLSNAPGEGLPRSDSLYQIRSLRGRMQKIEARVHSARSKLPAPRQSTTPKNSPRTGSALSDKLPSSVTMRRSIRRPSMNVESQVDGTSDGGVSETASRRESRTSRLSFGIPRPPSSASERPASAMDRPPSAAAASRPTSRASLLSGSATLSANRPGSRTGARTPLGQLSGTATVSANRPSSRAGTRTPLGGYAGTNGVRGHGRSNSTLGGNYATIHGTPRTHRPSASVSELRGKAAESEDSSALASTLTPSRRTTVERTGLPTLSFGKRQSGGGLPTPSSKRTSAGFGGLDDSSRMPPPRRKMSDVGETY